ncbi:MAG: MarR family transcriptional regulator, partial [Sphingobacteriales bacterium]
MTRHILCVRARYEAETQVGMMELKPEGSARDLIRASTNESYRAHSDLLYLMHELSRMVSTHADKHLAKAGVTHVQWWAMMHIYEHEGLTQTQLAERMQMGRASFGKLVERLEAKAWIERRPDSTDSRVRRVFLRHAAVSLFKHMTEEGNILFKEFLAGIPP